ncbi:low temperature requirement protein A [Mycetocola sp.]|uniref:low temperature requirement protein A n=1 Tax=Mycetocola sp. TaxID=1871042 RepID=UPI00260C690D|nr:low temperature requirement protein A [Mycetocola sp.]MCU1559434.1 low temperature requirement protein [Mycetocola sp.]
MSDSSKQPGGLLRATDGDQAHRVTFVELFFDLVFVFAVTQISHSLIENQNLFTLVQTVILIGAVWRVWVDTTWVTNWLDPDHRRVRGMLFVLMLLGVLMSSAIPEAFGERALLFAVTMVAIQLGRSIFTALAFRRSRPDNYLNFVRIAIWNLATGVLWLGGAVAPEELRLPIWLVAVVVDMAGPRLRFVVPGLGRSEVETWNVSGAHMAERVSLFLIIVLGESILVTGRSFAEGTLGPLAILAFLAAFTSTLLMWLLYFNHGQEHGSDFISGSSKPGLIAQVAYTYIPLLLVTGILLTAVADEIVLVHPLGGNEGAALERWTAGLICGSSVVYLMGNLLFKRAVGLPWLRSHLAGAGALVILFFAFSSISPLLLSWLANLVLVAVVVADHKSYRRGATG